MAAAKSTPFLPVYIASSAEHSGGTCHRHDSKQQDDHQEHVSGAGERGAGEGGGGYEVPSAGRLWLGLCFVGIVASFVVYGIVIEYATSGGRELHELSLVFVTSLMCSMPAHIGRRANREVCTVSSGFTPPLLSFRWDMRRSCVHITNL